jgi:hypothetical protein
VFTFLLNFIPNIGSLIAIVLPIPIILVEYVPASFDLYYSIGKNYWLTAHATNGQ